MEAVLSQMVFVSIIFIVNSFNDFLDIFAVTTVVETPTDAGQVALLVQLPRQQIHPWPESKLSSPRAESGRAVRDDWSLKFG